MRKLNHVEHPVGSSQIDDDAQGAEGQAEDGNRFGQACEGTPPGGVVGERSVLDEVVSGINRTDGEAQSVRLETFRWEKNVFPGSARARRKS